MHEAPLDGPIRKYTSFESARNSERRKPWLRQTGHHGHDAGSARPNGSLMREACREARSLDRHHSRTRRARSVAPTKRARGSERPGEARTTWITLTHWVICAQHTKSANAAIKAARTEPFSPSKQGGHRVTATARRRRRAGTAASICAANRRELPDVIQNPWSNRDCHRSHGLRL